MWKIAEVWDRQSGFFCWFALLGLVLLSIFLWPVGLVCSSIILCLDRCLSFLGCHENGLLFINPFHIFILWNRCKIATRPAASVRSASGLFLTKSLHFCSNSWMARDQSMIWILEIINSQEREMAHLKRPKPSNFPSLIFFICLQLTVVIIHTM